MGISLDQQPEVWYSLLSLYAQAWFRGPTRVLPKHIETKMLTTCFNSYKAFLKTKRSLELVAVSHSVHDFWRKIFIMLCSTNWPNFSVWLPLLFEISSNIFIVIACVLVYDVIKFEIYLSIFIQLFSYITKKVSTKM